MANPTAQYIYPIQSVVLPKRLHTFLAFQIVDSIIDATTREYHQIIEVFYPKLALPLNLAKDVLIRLFQIMVLPLLRRPKSFDKDTCVYSYISTDGRPQHERPHPTQTQVLPQNLIKFIDLHDEPTLRVEATSEEYHRIIDMFYPMLQLPSKSCDHGTLTCLFDIMVLPFFRRLEDFDELSGRICYLTAEVLSPHLPNKPPIHVITLPRSLHSFLAYVDPKVSVVPGPTNAQMTEIINLFHPDLDEPWTCDHNDPDDGMSMGPFNIMVLPYLRNVVSFNFQSYALTYYKVDI
ncbi:hypothetical protein DFH28DRAFT_892857 [Melampsora americana]|nr:hypothetical protein DFH28DRAFT_1083175 [Melampsora americana]KAH9815451.1 hypothetical protein DFH28DRAFT_892857 [Melampsora americana]